MSTYSYDLATLIGQVRLLIADNDIVPITDAHFSDEEIQAFLVMASDSVNIAAAIALESWAGYLSENADSERIGDYAYTKKQVSNKLALAQRLRDSEAGVPLMDIASFDLTGGSAITTEED